MMRGTGYLSLFLILSTVSCGKKGPPLPPLVRVPVAPSEFTAVRRGSTVDIQFVVPGGNTDGSTPADLVRVDVYALTGADTLTPDQILLRGTRVGSVRVNPPPDPEVEDKTPSQSPKLFDPEALDQGAVARLTEPFDVDPADDPSQVRAYIVVGVNKRGRNGPRSPRVTLPVGAAPAPPPRPAVTWDETSITVTWNATEVPPDAALSYRVYSPGEPETMLTEMPLTETRFVDQRIQWGAERCYAIRSVQTVGSLSLESDASEATCVTLTDTFPPAAPTGLTWVASEGSVNLIWTPNSEKDLAGYIVLRAVAPETTLTPVTPTSIVESIFTDSVPSGAKAIYAVQAVDKAGNKSPMSATAEVTAR